MHKLSRKSQAKSGSAFAVTATMLTCTFCPVNKGSSISSDIAPRDGSPDMIFTTWYGWRGEKVNDTTTQIADITLRCLTIVLSLENNPR